MTDNVIDGDKPRCSRCAKYKSVDELNGFDPFAAIGSKYKNAYCRKIEDCDSDKARMIIGSLVVELNPKK